VVAARKLCCVAVLALTCHDALLQHAGHAEQAGQASASGVTSGTKQGISAGGAASVGNLGGGGATKGKLLPVRATRGLAPAR